MMNDRLKLFAPLIIFVLLATVFFVLQKRIASGEYDPSALPSQLVGKELPEFSLSELENASITLTRDNLDRLPALVNVWATWCIACRAEHAYLNQLAESGVTLYGLNYKDERPAALQWLSRLGNPYVLNLFDEQGKLGLNMGVYGAPETYVLDQNGKVRYRHVGVMSETVWQEKILPLRIQW